MLLVGGRGLTFRLKCMCLKGCGGGGVMLPPGDRTCAFSGVVWGEGKVTEWGRDLGRSDRIDLVERLF